MPIKKKNLERYPPNWRQISWHIINIRAENRCEGILDSGERCGAMNGQPHPVTGKKVVLQVAHLDHTPEHSDQDLPPDAPLEQSNMRAFCQRCHNRWDREHRNESIKETYREKHEDLNFLKDDIIGTEIPWITPPPEDKIWLPAQQAAAWEQMAKEAEDLAFRNFSEQADGRYPPKIPSQASIKRTILQKSLELQEEYLVIMAMSDKEIGTPQVQARLTIYRSKMAVIDRLRALSKIIAEHQEEETVEEAEPIIEPELNMRGLGIRKLIEDRKKGRI